MKVVLNQTAQTANDSPNAPAHAAPTRVSNRTVAPAEIQQSPNVASTQETQSHPLPAGIPQTNITFRRDASGQIYYVLTDAQSGKELRQVPPEELRKVGEGIEEYLQKQAAKPAQHVELKA